MMSLMLASVSDVFEAALAIDHGVGWIDIKDPRRGALGALQATEIGAIQSANRIGGWFKDAYRGDQVEYWKADLPAIVITDTGEFRMSHYHLPGDLPDTLDYAFLRRVVQAVTATALHRAEFD